MMRRDEPSTAEILRGETDLFLARDATIQGQTDILRQRIAQLEQQIVGLAKEIEEIFLPGVSAPLILPRDSQALYLVQRVRDEAHRFALTFHRQKRQTSSFRSELDTLQGVGPKRKKALIRKFGSVKRIREATVEEIASVEGIGPALARQISDSLRV